MAKRYKIGSVVKAKDGKPPYIKLGQGVSITVNGVPVKNTFLNLVNPHTLPDELLRANKISEEVANSMKERASKIPFVINDIEAYDKE